MRDIVNELERRRLDAYLVTNETNVSYLSGFQGHDSMLLVSPKRKFFITDSRYIEEARESVKDYEMTLVESSTYTTIKSIVTKHRLKRLGYESMNLPYEVAFRLKGLLEKTRLVPIRDLVENVRSIKDSSEITLIKKSICLTKKILDKAVALIRPGVSEEEIAKTVEIEFIKNGAHAGFAPIIACGANSSRPHARSTDRVISKSDHVMVDIGCNLNGYNSDMTRMVVVGKIKARFRKIYNIIRAAHDMAIDKIAPGVRAAQIDGIARGYIARCGLGKYFGHSLGHGVGMDVHELPNISKRSEVILRPGMVFTIEPAAYIPRFGGVRIEDMVLVTDDGCEILTNGN